MKKIYSLVLMAVILLLGTNAWAGSVSTWDDLKTALQAGGNVTLSADINVTATNDATWRGIWIGSESVDGDAPKAVLDLNGHDIIINSGNYQKSGVTKEQALNPFAITKGSLTIKSDSPAKIQVVKGQSVISKGTNVFSVFGADDANKVDPKGNNPFTYLEIGKNVTVETQNGSVVAIDALKVGHAAVGSNTNYTTYPTGETSGYAYGARIEIKGSLISQGAESTTVSGTPKSYQNKCYGIKVNGLVASPADENKMYAPYVHIHPSAVLQSDNRSGEVNGYPIMAGSAAVYASGFAQWLIEGNCSGATGVYIGSGILVINDAQVKSAADVYDAAGAGGHANGSGSAIVINSRSNYPGEVAVTVTGDTKAEATSGYALEDVVNTTDNNSKVENITIQGGTFEGGAAGALVVTQATATEATVNVTGGNVEGTGNIGTDNLATYLNNQGGTHTTLIEDGGKTVLVISGGDAPTGMADFVSNADLSVKWTGASKDITGTFALKELEINESSAQILTVKEDATFKVERVILGANAKIIVEPGAKFIVTGEQGIVAPSVDNIVLQANSTNQALFLFNPNVTSNRHPNATVQLYTNCKQLESTPKKVYTYQRLTIPVMAGSKPANDFSGELFPGQSSFLSYAWYWNGNIWAAISGWTELKPFIGYEFANNSKNGGVTYTFQGELVGNGDAEYNFPTGGFDYFGCSHMAPIYVDSLLKPYENTNMEATAWVYDFSTSNWQVLNADEIAAGFAPEEIQPMTAFVLRLKGASGKSGMNYASAIWGNPNLDAVLGRPSQKNPAPARNRANGASNRAFINVMAENGNADVVKLIENDVYTAEFENGSDASKLMSVEGINLYATTEVGDLARVATDNLMGTLLSFRSGNSTEYTINLSYVIGEDYALRDNVTGQVIAFAEGATYTFTQDANTTVPARFEVIDAAKVPTAIDNVEEAAKTNGIYTVTGQYMGRDFTKVPAGVYIVNGIKVVK